MPELFISAAVASTPDTRTVLHSNKRSPLKQINSNTVFGFNSLQSGPKVPSLVRNSLILSGGGVKVDFRISTISIPHLKKRDFVTHYYTNLPQKPNWLFFWSNFLKYTQFCKLGALSLKRKLTHRYTNNDEKAPFNLWASPYTINQWVSPPPPPDPQQQICFKSNLKSYFADLNEWSICCHLLFFCFNLFLVNACVFLLYTLLRSAELGALHLLVTVGLLLCAFSASWLLSRPVLSWFCCICQLNKINKNMWQPGVYQWNIWHMSINTASLLNARTLNAMTYIHVVNILASSDTAIGNIKFTVGLIVIYS